MNINISNKTPSDRLNDNDIYNDQCIENIIMTNNEIAGTEFVNCQFVKCKFNETIFNKCRFEKCTFKECDLSLMKPSYSSFIDIVFDSTKCIGIDWVLSAKPLTVDFTHSIVSFSSFFGINLRKMIMTSCIAIEVDFAEANLTEGKFNQTDLAGSRFLKTNMTKADFTYAYNYNIDPSLNTLSKTKFSIPEAISLLSTLDIILE